MYINGGRCKESSKIKMLKTVGVLTILGVALGLPTNLTQSEVSPRIVGGYETDIESNPWQLALLYHRQHYCGAVEIHPLWALTAAHCMEGAIVSNLAVRAGSVLRNSGGEVVNVVVIYIHPNFNIRTVDYDFALLLLQKPITIQTASPVILPEPNFDFVQGDDVFITGWGLTSVGGIPSEILRRVDVFVVGDELCQWVQETNTITDRMFCAGFFVNGGRDACQGDGGGPVIIKNRLAGLVSWGSGCGKPYPPGVNAKVTSVLDWIYETTDIIL